MINVREGAALSASNDLVSAIVHVLMDTAIWRGHVARRYARVLAALWNLLERKMQAANAPTAGPESNLVGSGAAYQTAEGPDLQGPDLSAFFPSAASSFGTTSTNDFNLGPSDLMDATTADQLLSNDFFIDPAFSAFFS